MASQSGCGRPTIFLACGQVYPLFNHRITSAIGGMETRAALIAKGLAASGGWNVGFIVEDFGQPNVVRHGSIVFYTYIQHYQRAANNVLPRFKKRWWFPVINGDRNDIYLIWQLPLVMAYHCLPSVFFSLFWRRHRPDIVCCFGNNAQSAEIIADCYRSGIKTILSLASDQDVSADYSPDDYAISDYGTPHWMGHYALETADRIIVQTSKQLNDLKCRFGRDGVLIRNPINISSQDPSRWTARHKREFVLWIGRSDSFNKRPLLFLSLAKSCPNMRFLMVVNRTDATVFETLVKDKPDNLEVIENVPHNDIWDYYARARVFVNTSNYEGFPNTFLQCAVSGVPIVSLDVDPEQILSRHGCGLLADGSVHALEKFIRTLWDDHEQSEILAYTFHQYALAHHAINECIQRWEACLQELRDDDSMQQENPVRRCWQGTGRFIRRPRG